MSKILLKKITFVFSVCVVSLFLFGCREDEIKVTVFNGLPPSKYLNEFSSALEHNQPIAISFTADWCPHCRKYKPVFFEVQNIYSNKAVFINIDMDSPDGEIISKRFQVKGIPTTAFVRQDGSVFKVQVGGIEKLELVDTINDLLKDKKRKSDQPFAPFPIQPVVPVEEEEPLPQELINDSQDETKGL